MTDSLTKLERCQTVIALNLMYSSTKFDTSYLILFLLNDLICIPPLYSG